MAAAALDPACKTLKSSRHGMAKAGLDDIRETVCPPGTRGDNLDQCERRAQLMRAASKAIGLLPSLQ
jgi:hypothetical protein